MSTFREDYDLTVRGIQGVTQGRVTYNETCLVALMFTAFKRLVDFVQSKPDVKTQQPNPFDLTNL